MHDRPVCRCHIGGKEVYLKKVYGANELLLEFFNKRNGGSIKKLQKKELVESTELPNIPPHFVFLYFLYFSVINKEPYIIF